MSSSKFCVIEFGDGGGGVSVIRQEWLTTRKKHSVWPPVKVQNKFNKCLEGSILPDDTWSSFTIKRVFYETDDLSKAREKAKQAETESEVESEWGERRRRKKTKRIYGSDDSNENSEDSIIRYPITRPPSTPSSHTNSDVTLITHDNKPEITLPNISSLDLTLVDPSSHSLDIIAKRLASIEIEIKEINISQQEILQRVRSSSTIKPFETLPEEIKLPCDNIESLNSIETWIVTDKNAKQLVTYLSFVGGSKVPTITRRILEKLFTNKLALLYNWTGKNAKLPLKNMQLIKVIRDAVRHNKIAEKATDSEILAEF
ncbi:hypothetical protein ACJJTC_012721 [Scirpophaga incertulas]